MALELVKLDSATLPGIADAIREKTGGTDLMLPSEMKAAIRNTLYALPDLTAPAEVGHVLAGKEYIDGNGNKKTGTLVVADSLFAAEVYLEGIGVGAAVTVESSVDGSNKDLTLPEPNLIPENIKSGVMIYGCTGNAKILRVETGTITPAEDTTTLTIPCAANPMAIIVCATDAARADILGGTKNALLEAACMNHAIKVGAIGSETQKIYASLSAFNQSSGKIIVATGNAIIGDTVTVGVAVQTFQWIAGAEYQWTAYYWEDDA